MVTYWQFPFVASDQPALQHTKLSPSFLFGSSWQPIRCKGTHWVLWHVAHSKIVVTVGSFGWHLGIRCECWKSSLCCQRVEQRPSSSLLRVEQFIKEYHDWKYELLTALRSGLEILQPPHCCGLSCIDKACEFLVTYTVLISRIGCIILTYFLWICCWDVSFRVVLSFCAGAVQFDEFVNGRRGHHWGREGVL